MPQIEVTFDIDSNGILSVSAKDKGTGKEQKITIQNATNLTKEEVEQMTKEAEAHAREDEEKKTSAESKNKLDATIFTGEKTLKDFADKIKPEDKEQIENKLKEARELLAKTEVNKDQFDKMSEELGQILQTVGQAVYGKGDASKEEAEPEEAAKEETKKDDKKAEEGEIVN